jgi:MoxR-like ATPase
MKRVEYTGNPEKRPADAKPWPLRRYQPDPRNYIPGQRLVHAVQVAMTLDRPLILTGDPGTGKTQLAYSIAWELGLPEPLSFETKSTSSARDLFYSYDAIGHFRRSQSGETKAIDFITWNPLGEAILRSNPRHEIETRLKRPMEGDFDCQMVVLIDEIDKAPRDFPNDLLNEFERKFFRVPELGPELGAEPGAAGLRPFEANPARPPILILTSNSERNLPEAFLRRCAFFHIEFPVPDELKKILQRQLKEFAKSEDSPLIREALQFFRALRDEEVRSWEKRPATAELIDWLTILRERGANPDQPLRNQKEVHLETLSIIVKGIKDQAHVLEMVEKGSW